MSSPRVPRYLILPGLVWVVVALASALAAPAHQLEALGGVVRLGGGLLIGLAVYQLSGAIGRRELIARALAAAGVLVALVGLGELVYTARFGLTNAELVVPPLPTGDIARATAGLGHPNAVAMMLELTLPLVLVWAATSQAGLKRGLLGVALVATVLALLLTFSRAGLMACLASLGLMAGVAARYGRRDILGVALAAIGLLVVLAAAIVALNPGAIWRLAGETEQRWYRALYDAPHEVVARPGESILVPVLVTNSGEWPWHEAGPYRFALGYHLARADGTRLVYDGPSTPLPSAVLPGDSVEVHARMRVPPMPGEYVVEWDGIQEAVTWFSWRGTPVAKTHLRVAGEPVAEGEGGATEFEGGVVEPAPGRLISWETALRMTAARPVLGYGLDSFPRIFNDYVGATRWPAVHSHNLYLEWLAGAGLAGLGAFLWFNWRVVASVGGSLRWIRRSEIGTIDPGRTWAWQLGFAAGLTAWFAHGVVDYFEWSVPTYLVFWLIVGLAVRAVEATKGKEQGG